MIDLIVLKKIMLLCPRERALLFLQPLNDTMREFSISVPERAAAFLAQIAHESAQLRYVLELASGEAYEGRKDLGNTETGDGARYRGRGLIQITGRANYKKCGDALGVNLIDDPEQLEEPELATRSAGWFWDSHHLNNLADRGDFKGITKSINGGLTGYTDRLGYWQRAKLALGAE
jgi:putative chitinase